MPTRRHLLTSLAVAGVAGTAVACSPDGSGSGSGSGASGGSDAGGAGTLTFRLWDEGAVAAYEESFAAFTEKTGWNVTIDLVPWSEYWTQLPLDVAGSTAADVYWMNSANYVQYQSTGNLLAIDEVVGSGTGDWEKAVVDLYTREDHLWGVPQLWDSIALFYNKALLDAAGIDPASLSFDPAAASDPLREAGAALTVDGAGRHPGEEGFDANSRSQFGFNAQADRQAIIGPFLASNGAQWQVDDLYAFDSPEGVAVMQYLADLINVQQVAPSAADTNENGDFSRDLFVQGKLGLFQSGPYNLTTIHETVGEDFEWGIAPMVGGPAGEKSLVHGVVAVGNAKADEDQQAGIKELLTWLGSADGQRPLGAHGVAFPGRTDVQDAFVDYWADQGVDVSVFTEAAQDPAQADTGAKANAGLTAAMPFFQEIMIGRLSAAEGMKQAQEAGNAAMA